MSSSLRSLEGEAEGVPLHLFDMQHRAVERLWRDEVASLFVGPERDEREFAEG